MFTPRSGWLLLVRASRVTTSCSAPGSAFGASSLGRDSLSSGVVFDRRGDQYRERLLAGLGTQLAAYGITWLDSVEDVRSVYQAADVSVSPSRSENHGAALEASAMGVPCLVSDAGGLPEAIPPGHGWMHRAGSVDDLARALHDSARAFRKGHLVEEGRRARSFVEHNFDSSVLTRQVIDALTQW